MLVGTYRHKLESSKRVFVPVEIRNEFPSGFLYKYEASTHCAIRCFSKEEYQKEIDSATEKMDDPDDIMEYYLNAGEGVYECTYDKLGRVVINSDVIEQAGISDNCIFVGAIKNFFIFGTEAHAEFLENKRRKDKAKAEAREGEEAVRLKLKKEGRFIQLPDQTAYNMAMSGAQSKE